MRKVAVATMIAAGIVAAGVAVSDALAAPDPTVGDVIKALTVSPNRTRGSRPVQTPGTPPAAAAATAAPTAAPGAATAGAAAAVEGTGAIDLNVQFAAGIADLTPAARGTLDVLGQALTSAELATARIRIEGHTDTTGSREANLALSWRRASAAVAYLQEKFRIPAARLEAAGRGQADLLIKTGENVDEPRNRRVHVVNISR